MREIQSIVVHCSDSKWGDADVIASWHRKRGFDSCGYHAIVNNGFRKNSRVYDMDFDGKIEPGRSQDLQGAHVRGHNAESLGVCLIGVDEFTPGQFAALRKLLDVWCSLYNIPPELVLGHRDLDDKKTCPNFDAGEWYTGKKEG